MTEILYRTAVLTPGTGRQLHGVCVPFGQVATITEPNGYTYRERFAPGSTTRTIAERGHKVRLLVGHDQRRFPVGRASRLWEEPDGLHGVFDVAETRDGDDLLVLARDGLVDSFSVGFSPVREVRDEDGVVVRTEVALREVSVTCTPAYSGAVIAGVRSESNSLVIPRSVAEARLALMDWK